MTGHDDKVTLEHTIALYRGLPTAELAIVPGTPRTALGETRRVQPAHRRVLDDRSSTHHRAYPRVGYPTKRWSFGQRHPESRERRHDEEVGRSKHVPRKAGGVIGLLVVAIGLTVLVAVLCWFSGGSSIFPTGPWCPPRGRRRSPR